MSAVSFSIIARIFTIATVSEYSNKTAHMELAEWLVRRALELVSRVRRSARSSSMMRILHSYKNPSCNYVA